MKYLAQTISDHILKTAAGKEVARFVLPSYPARVLLKVGIDLEERLDRLTTHRVAFVYGIARRLVDQWSASVSTGDQAAASQARGKAWYNVDDNLTALRNRQRDPKKEDALVALIAGYGHIDDQASLRDFYHVDQPQVWGLCLRRSFKPWVEAKLGDADLEADGSAVAAAAEVLDTLYAHGLADLPAVSSYLEGLDLSGASGPGEAYRLVLGRLEPFNLPRMASLAAAGRKRSFATYVTPAQEFLNYSRFLDDTARKGAAKSIDRYETAEKRREPREEDLGEFGSLAELLASLRQYVEDGSDEDRRRLKTADFPFILDAVLGYRRPRSGDNGPEPIPKVKKLSGLPPEVFLRALWLTLGEYVNDAEDRDATPQEELRGITLQSRLFRHDLETDEEDGTGPEGDNDRARAFLGRVLGGLDRLLEEQIDLSKLRDGEAVKLDSRLCPGANRDILCARTAIGEPHLAFRVAIAYDGGSLEREYLWRLPQNHQTYLLGELFNWTYGWFAAGSNGLPAFTVPYVPELFLAQDEEDVNRLTGMALRSHGRRVVNLLAAPGIGVGDPVMPSLVSLSVAYQTFLSKLGKEGLFAALAEGYDGLRQAYESACEAYLRHAGSTSLGGLLFKAFSLFDVGGAAEDLWAWREYADGFVATPLHPAVLDMLRNQHSFFCEGFSAYATDALVKVDLKSRPFAEGKWNALVDLARMDRPLFGTLRDSTHVLDSTVRGFGYLHLVGNCRAPLTGITSRLLLEYDPTEDGDEVEDEDLFRETRASRLVRTVLLDYRAMHCHAEDGLTIGAYCGGEIQPLIAGIDRYLEKAVAERVDAPYGLRLVLFSAARDDSSVTRWLDAWRDRWQAAELPVGKTYYGKCKISIAYRVVSADSPAGQFAALLRRTPLDVLFFTDFVAADESHFDPLPVEQLPDDAYRKFPILEKACCAVTGGAMSFKRLRTFSNRRFELAALHGEVMARLSRGPVDAKLRHAVVSSSDFLPWRGAVDAGHQASSWVVCIDPTVDERLLHSAQDKGSRGREIIGFGTGVGAHGEANFTISTEQFVMADVKKKISSQLALRFGSWDATTRDGIADSLVREAAGMAGLSVVKATGPSEYVRDYISYATVRKLLPRDTQAFCDELVSLDAFRHWFDDAEDRLRPDLLRVRARIVDGFFRVEAQVLECKLAQQSEGYLSEARAQVEAGLKRLSRSMRPRESSKPVGLEDRPDQRYWWMQLHRLIASRGSTSMPHYGETLAALERLSEGYFDISWQGAVVAFWTDLQGGDPRLEAQWPVTLDEQTAIVPAMGTAGDFVRRACLEGSTLDLFSGATAVWRRFFRRDDKGQGPDIGSEPAKPEKPTGSAGEQSLWRPVSDRPMGEGDAKPPSEETGREERGDGEKQRIAPGRGHDRILLGASATGGKKDVYWEFGHRDLPNRHILVFGASGTGKTYTIQALLCELGKADQNALIVDYTNGFTTNQLEEVVREKLRPRQHVVRREPLPVNPFRRQCDFIEGEAIDEDPTITAQRVRGVFSEVYLLGDQQKSALYTAIRDGIAKEGASFSLVGLMTRLEELRASGGTLGGAAGSVASKIQPFVDMNPFGREDPESWEKLFNDRESRCHVIQLTGFARDTARLITEFSLIDLYRYYRASGNKDRPRVIVLDEVQVLDHSLDSPLGQLLTEGRKFGISLILATQTLSNLDKDQRDRLFQASHTLFFKPANTELRSFAQILESATGERTEDWVRRLSSLGKGECYSLGPAINESSQSLDTKRYFRIRIKALRERF